MEINPLRLFAVNPKKEVVGELVVGGARFKFTKTTSFFYSESSSGLKNKNSSRGSGLEKYRRSGSALLLPPLGKWLARSLISHIKHHTNSFTIFSNHQKPFSKYFIKKLQINEAKKKTLYCQT